MLVDGLLLLEGSTAVNMVIASGTSFPANANVGELFYRTDTLSLNAYTGAAWASVGGVGTFNGGTVTGATTFTSAAPQVTLGFSGSTGQLKASDVGGGNAGSLVLAGGNNTGASGGGGNITLRSGGAAGNGQGTGSVYIHAQASASNVAAGGTIFFGAGGTTVDAPTERLRIIYTGAFGLGGANYGEVGQAIVSNGASAAPTWQNVGLPRTTTFDANAIGKRIAVNAGFTVPASTYAAGDAFSFYNDSALPITITQGSGLTLRQDGTANTGNRQFAARGTCFLWFNSTTEAVISGSLT